VKSIYIAAIAAIFSFNASAKIMAEADGADGAVFVFHDEPGPCVGRARLVEYVAKDGSKVGGCWVTRGQNLACTFFDADVGAVAITALRAPKQS
jgi:hypothetical protein